MKPPPKIWSKVMKDLYGKNYCFVKECNYIWGNRNHTYIVEWFNLEAFPMVINLN